MICKATRSKSFGERPGAVQLCLLEHVRFFDGCATIDTTRSLGVDGTATVGTVADLRSHATISDAIAHIDLADPGEQLVFRNAHTRAEQFPHGLTDQRHAVERKFEVAN